MGTRPGKLAGFVCFLPLVVASFCARAADRTLPVSVVSEAGAQVLVAAEQEARKLNAPWQSLLSIPAAYLSPS